MFVVLVGVVALVRIVVVVVEEEEKVDDQRAVYYESMFIVSGNRLVTSKDVQSQNLRNIS